MSQRKLSGAEHPATSIKHCTAEELGIAVRGVLRGESYLSPLVTKDTVQYLLRSERCI